MKLGSSAGEAEFSVSDSGPGIKSKDQQRIFKKFERGGGSGHPGGLGLGLFITKEILESHGGTIFVESSEGKGATFWAKLPRASCSAGLEVPQSGASFTYDVRIEPNRS